MIDSLESGSGDGRIARSARRRRQRCREPVLEVAMQHIDMRGGINFPGHNWRGAQRLDCNSLALGSGQGLLIETWPGGQLRGRDLGPYGSIDRPMVKTCMEVSKTSSRPGGHAQAPTCRQQDVIDERR